MSKQPPESKGETPSSPIPQPFSYIDTYPQANLIFAEFTADFTDEDTLVALDTNTLLLPYGATQHTLDDISKVFKSIREQGRLFIPGHVAREFAVNRSNKIASIYQTLSNQKSISSPEISLRILKNDDDFKLLEEVKTQLESKINEYKSALSKVLKNIKEWNWNDPVSKLYREIFDESNIYDIPTDREKLSKEASDRGLIKMPPGYKDLTKEENAYGDLIIWKTLIELSKEKDKSIVFVSHDEKSDWWLKYGNVSINPRFELKYEFKLLTGHDIHIIKLSDLMSKFEVSKKSVDEVIVEEKLQNLDYPQNQRNKGDFKPARQIIQDALEKSQYTYTSWPDRFIVEFPKGDTIIEYLDERVNNSEIDNQSSRLHVLAEENPNNTYELFIIYSNRDSAFDGFITYPTIGQDNFIVHHCVYHNNMILRYYSDSTREAEGKTTVYIHRNAQSDKSG